MCLLFHWFLLISLLFPFPVFFAAKLLILVYVLPKQAQIAHFLSSWDGSLDYKFSFFFKIYLFIRERKREHTEGERKKQIPHWAGSQMWGLIPGPQDHGLSQRQKLNQLSHLGASKVILIKGHISYWDRITPIIKMSVLPKLFYKFNSVPILINSSIFMKLGKLIVNIIWKTKIRTVREILKQKHLW